MRKSLALKTILRSPLITLLTFLLIAAASFALFSRVTDYVVNIRETENARSLYHAVASLDNEVPDISVETKAVQSADGNMNGYCTVYEMEDKSWPTKEELQEFSSLPGVTLADTRYMTAGLVRDYKRILGGTGDILLEGTFNGYIDDRDKSVYEDHVRLIFDDVKVIAGESEFDIGTSIITEDVPLGDMYYAKSPFTHAFYDGLEKGSRCLMMARDSGPGSAGSGIYFAYDKGKEALCVIDGLAENYLETEPFVRQKGWADAISHNNNVHDVVYTSDMRAIPEFNEQRLKLAEGRFLAAQDTDVCVVSEDFLREHGLSVGDSISVRLGDRLCHENAFVFEGEDVPEFGDFVNLPIVGAYSSGSPNTIYVPSSLLQVKVPDDYETKPDEFSVFVEKAGDIEAFYEAAGQFAERLDLKLVFSDRGWLDVKDSFGMGALASLFTAVLYIVGAVLALFLAVYLYIGRNRKPYAIMRMLGVSGREAGISVLLPFAALAVLAAPVGGVAGLFYAQEAAKKALLRMAGNAPAGYVPNAELPINIVLLCLFSEVLFVSVATYFFLRSMRKSPPLELLQEGTKSAKKANNWQEQTAAPVTDFVPTMLDIGKLLDGEWMPRRKYGSIRHITAYIRRHMWRATGRTAVSLMLAVVLAAGIGSFVLAKITYRDAFYELSVKGSASDFIFCAASELSASSLVKDFYCYDTFGVRMEGEDSNILMTVTSDLARYMGDGYMVDYADGYGLSAFDGTAQVCLIGEKMAKKLNISKGDEIGVLSDLLYTTREDQGGEEAVSGYRKYKVIGIAETENVNVGDSILTGIRSDPTGLFAMEFPVAHCEFTLADNDRLGELEELLQEMEERSIMYSPDVSHHVDFGGLADIERIRGMLESVFPIAVAAAVLIGMFGSLLVILQSAQEAAFLRILGVTKKRTRCMLALEQAVLSIAGVMLVAGGLALYDPGRFARGIETFVACFGLYFLGCVCGAAAAAVQVTRHRLLELFGKL